MNYSPYLINLEDLVENPTARIPVCLCLDVSGSMSGNPIEELNKGIEAFYEAIKEDEMALFSAEICIVTFGWDVKLLSDFSTLDKNTQIPVLNASGGTPLGEAVNLALDSLEQRKKQYQDSGVDYYQPWLVLMTDGQPNGDWGALNQAIQRTVNLVENKKLTIFPIGIGQEADMRVLSKFSPNRQPLRLQGLKFKEFFTWLSQSVSRTSQSMPGEDVILDVEGIKGWGAL